MDDVNQLPEGAVPLASEAAPEAPTRYNPNKVIEIELPNGTRIEMRKPRSISTAIAGLMGDVQSLSPVQQEIERNRALTLLFITSIDGVPEPMVMNPIMRAALEEKIGIEFLDALFEVRLEQFPDVSKAELKVVKKS